MNTDSKTLVTAIQLALPDSRAKRLSRLLGVSIQTAKRLATHGVIGRKRLPSVIEILDGLIAENQRAMENARQNLRAHEASLRPAASRDGAAA